MFHQLSNANLNIEFIPSYNLLIHLVRSSEHFDKYLDILLKNLSTPPTSSPANGAALSVSVLSTIYNVLPVQSHQRYPVYHATLKVVGAHGLYELLVPQLKHIEKWVGEWGATTEEIRGLYTTIANIALTSEDHEYVVRPVMLSAVLTISQASLQLLPQGSRDLLRFRRLRRGPRHRRHPRQDVHQRSQQT